MNVTICCTVAVAAALLGLSWVRFVQVIFDPTLDVPDSNYDQLFRNPIWYQLFLVIGGTLLTIALLIPLANNWNHNRDAVTVIFLSLLGLSIPIGLYFGALENRRTHAILRGNELVLRRGKKEQRINLQNVRSVMSVQFATGLKMNDGSVKILPSMLGWNQEMRSRIRSQSGL